MRVFKTRRLVRVALTTLLVMVVVLAGAAAATYYWAKGTFDAIPKFGSNDVRVAEYGAGEPTTFLVVGSDSRENLDAELSKATGAGRPGTAGQRADVIIVVHVDPKTKKAFVLSIPRDLKVMVPGRGPDKINAAFASENGAQRTIDTVQQFTGLQINHYVQLDFRSFRDIVDALGGLDMDFPYAVRDTKINYKWPAGTRHLNGSDALSFIRSRHYQQYIDGRWVADGSGDVGRVKRQQDFIWLLLGKLNGAGSVTKAVELADVARKYLKVDANFDFETALRLYRDLTPVSQEKIEFVALPVGELRESGVDYYVAGPEAEQILSRLRGEASGTSRATPSIPATPPTPGSVRVEVLNGTQQSGLASTAADRLRKKGFKVGAVGDAQHKGFIETQVVFAPGAEEKAKLVAAALGLGAAVPGKASDYDVVVILGADSAAPSSTSR